MSSGLSHLFEAMKPSIYGTCWKYTVGPSFRLLSVFNFALVSSRFLSVPLANKNRRHLLLLLLLPPQYSCLWQCYTCTSNSILIDEKYNVQHPMMKIFEQLCPGVSFNAVKDFTELMYFLPRKLFRLRSILINEKFLDTVQIIIWQIFLKFFPAQPEVVSGVSSPFLFFQLGFVEKYLGPIVTNALPQCLRIFHSVNTPRGITQYPHRCFRYFYAISQRSFSGIPQWLSCLPIFFRQSPRSLRVPSFLYYK